MRSPATWHRGPFLTLLLLWVIASAAALTLWITAEARSLEHALNDVAFRLGATESSVHVNVLGGWPRLALLYAAVVLLPPVLAWFVWRRASRVGDRSVTMPPQAI